MVRFSFNIRTRSGQRVENISIMAACQEDAERRLRQMYVQCVVMDCRAHALAPRDSMTLPRVMRLIGADAALARTGTH